MPKAGRHGALKRRPKAGAPPHAVAHHQRGIGLRFAELSVVSLPGLPLIPLIYTSQVVNAVVLPLHVIALQLLANDASIMGAHGPSSGRGWRAGPASG